MERFVQAVESMAQSIDNLTTHFVNDVTNLKVALESWPSLDGTVHDVLVHEAI